MRKKNLLLVSILLLTSGCSSFTSETISTRQRLTTNTEESVSISNNRTPSPSPKTITTSPPTATPAPLSASTPEVTAVPIQTEDAPDNTITYFGNANIKKFNRLNYPSVKKMKEENKITLNSRDEPVSKGFDPCQNCNP